MEFYIYQMEMDGSRCLGDTVQANTKEEATKIYCQKNSVHKDDTWMFYALPKKKVDADRAKLKETGYGSWDEYEADMYPSRPIEL